MNTVHILNIHIILFLILIFGFKKKIKDKKWKCENFCQKTKQNKTKEKKRKKEQKDEKKNFYIHIISNIWVILKKRRLFLK